MKYSLQLINSVVAQHNIKTKGCDCVPVKLYLHKHATLASKAFPFPFLNFLRKHSIENPQVRKHRRTHVLLFRYTWIILIHDKKLLQVRVSWVTFYFNFEQGVGFKTFRKHLLSFRPPRIEALMS